MNPLAGLIVGIFGALIVLNIAGIIEVPEKVKIFIEKLFNNKEIK